MQLYAPCGHALFFASLHILMGTGGDHMDSQGTVVVRLSTSSALIPLQGATVTITKTRPDGTQELLAVRVTNFDGLTAPVMVETPPMPRAGAIRTHPSPMLRSTSASNAQALTGCLSKTRRFFRTPRQDRSSRSSQRPIFRARLTGRKHSSCRRRAFREVILCRPLSFPTFPKPSSSIWARRRNRQQM